MTCLRKEKHTDKNKNELKHECISVKSKEKTNGFLRPRDARLRDLF